MKHFIVSRYTKQYSKSTLNKLILKLLFIYWKGSDSVDANYATF